MRRRVIALAVLGPSLLLGASRSVVGWSPDRANIHWFGPRRPVPQATALSLSDDSGAQVTRFHVVEGTWTPTGAGLNADGIYGVWVDPTDPLVVYAAGPGGSLFRSTNAGEQWTFAGLISACSFWPAYDGYAVDDLVIDPSQPTVIYALAGSCYGGLYKSTDSGATWTDVSPKWYDEIMAVAIDPHVTSTLYLATTDGVFKSTDAGQSWKLASCGISLEHETPAALAIDPVDPSVIYTGTWCWNSEDPCIGGTVYRSTDGGANWTKTGHGLRDGLAIGRLVIDPVNTSNLYALTYEEGVYKSTDRGNSWRTATLTMPWLGGRYAALTVDPASSSTLYAIGPGGLFKTTDAGASWCFTSPSLWATWITSVAVAPSSPSIVYIGTTGHGINRSTDGGTTWQAMNAGLDAEWVYDVAASPSEPAKVYAAVFSDQDRIYASADSARSWAFAHGIMQYEPSMVVDHLDSARLWAISDDALFTSEDSGHTWAQASPRWSGLKCVAIDPAKSSIVYAGTYKGVYGSTDGGSSWTLHNSGMDDWPFVQSVAIDPADTMTLYAATRDGVYKSTDGGSSWEKANSGLGRYPRISTILVDPSDSLTLYALSRETVFKTQDGCASWHKAASGLEKAQVRSIALNPSHASVLGAVTSKGLFITKDGAKSWCLIRGAPSLDVTALEFDPAHTSTLYVGFGGCGLWKWKPGSAAR